MLPDGRGIGFGSTFRKFKADKFQIRFHDFIFMCH
jgi:hypothetical protein